MSDEYSYSLHMQGSATTLEPEDECEAVTLLRQCVKDVTGKDVEPPQKQRIGFLP